MSASTAHVSSWVCCIDRDPSGVRVLTAISAAQRHSAVRAPGPAVEHNHRGFAPACRGQGGGVAVGVEQFAVRHRGTHLGDGQPPVGSGRASVGEIERVELAWEGHRRAPGDSDRPVSPCRDAPCDLKADTLRRSGDQNATG